MRSNSAEKPTDRSNNGFYFKEPITNRATHSRNGSNNT